MLIKVKYSTPLSRIDRTPHCQAFSKFRQRAMGFLCSTQESKK